MIKELRMDWPQRRTPYARHRAATNARAKFKNAKRLAGKIYCEVCGWEPPHPSVWKILHVNHVIPVACSGNDSDANLVLLCPNHHAVASHYFIKRLDKRTGKRVYYGPTEKGALISWLRRFDIAPDYILEQLALNVALLLEGSI